MNRIEGRRTIRKNTPKIHNPMIPADGRRNREIKMWDAGTGAEGPFKEKLRAAYLGALDAVDRVEAHRTKAMASGNLTAAGVNDDTLKFAASQLAPAFSHGRRVIDAAKAKAKSLRDKITLAPPDKSDAVGFLRRQEMRRHLLEMDDKKRSQFISQNRESLDRDMVQAIVEMPAAFSGVLESDRNSLIDTALRAQHGPAMDELADLESAIEITQSAVTAGRNEIMEQTGVDAATFNAAAAPFENQTEVPWLRRGSGESVSVVDLGKGVLRAPTQEDLERGKYFKDKNEYDQANSYFIKNNSAA